MSPACYYWLLEVWRLIHPGATDGPAPPAGPWHLREFAPADAVGILALDHACAELGDGMVLDRDQLGDDASEVERRSAGSALQRVFVVECAGEIAGYASVKKLFPARLRHVAVLAVAVHPAFQRRGYGRALMCEAIAWAERSDVCRLELYVRSDNGRAISLYRSLGFELEGIRRGFIKTLSGDLIDDFIMARFLQPLTASAS